MKCEKCGNVVQDKYLYCPRCGAVLHPVQTSKRKKKWPVVLGCALVLGALAVGGGIFFMNHKGDNASDSGNSSQYDGDMKSASSETSDDDLTTEQSGTATENDTEGAAKVMENAGSESCYVLSAIEIVNVQKDFEQTVAVQWNNGDATECILQGQVEDEMTFSYDEKGLLIGIELEDVYFTFVSDSEGNILEEYYFDDEQVHKKTYTYDGMGNMLTFNYWNADGELYKSQECVYNSDSICTQSDNIEYDTDNGTIDFRVVNTYDDEGNILTSRSYSDDPNVVSNGTDYERIESDDGKKSTVIRWDLDGEKGIWYEYIYDEQGNVLSYEGFYSDDTLYFRNEYTYDDHGNMLSDIQVDSDEQFKYCLEYTYDSYGNLLSESELDRDGEIIWTKQYTYQKLMLEQYQIRRYAQLSKILETIF